MNIENQNKVQGQLEVFEQLIRKLPYKTEALAEYFYCIYPNKEVQPTRSDKKYKLTVTALVHGNEIVGVYVLNKLLYYLSQNLLELPFTIALGLANVPAALQGQRFLEHNLNRCFAIKQPQSWEQRRAFEMSAILGQSEYYLDLHQTTQKNELAFFIFPYTKANYLFARQIAPSRVIITHWGDSFSTEGLCTDEYVIQCGGTGITLEIGQCGHNPFLVNTGLESILNTLTFLANPASMQLYPDKEQGPTYTWSHTEPYPTTGYVQLDPALHNFADIKKGQILGKIDDTPLIASETGKMVFPVFLSKEQQKQQKQRPAELFRILKVLSDQDLANIPE